MGKPKYYRLNIKQQIGSLEYKNKYFQLKYLNIKRYGLCLAEAELLAALANDYYQNHLLQIPENHFQINVYPDNVSQKKQSLSSIAQKTVNIPAYSHYELEIYNKYGIRQLQNYRIINILDSIAFQQAKIDIALLSKIVNITPKSIRERLVPFKENMVKLPLLYMSDRVSSRTPVFRYSKALSDFFTLNVNETKALSNLLISKAEWTALLFNFYQFSYGQQGLFPQPLEQELSLLKSDVMKSPGYNRYKEMFPSINQNNSLQLAKSPKEIIQKILKISFSFSNALITDYLMFLEAQAGQSNNSRRAGEIIYYAVGENTAVGTPLIESEFVPVIINFFSQDDLSPESPYKTTERKWNKIMRYSIQTQNQHACLTQYDLSYLLGINVNVVKNLMKKHPDIFLPTRGNLCDIGPGVTHAEKIIELYLDGYTETEIKFKTRHSYQSIENYLKTFTKIVGLSDIGMNTGQIRMSAKISKFLTEKFLALYQKYNTKEYSWIMAKIRNNFNQTVCKKKPI